MTLQNDTSMDSASDTIGMSWKYYVPPGLFALIFVVAVTGNTLVLYVVAFFKKMRTIATCYLVNLAVTDLAFLLCCVPFTVVNYLTTSYAFGEAMCKFVSYIMQVTAQAACLSLALLGLDRYFAILHPVLSVNYRRKRVAIIGSIIVWIASFILALPTALYYRLETIKWNGESLKICRPNNPPKDWARGYWIYSLLCTYVIPLVVSLVTCSAIVYRLYHRFQPNARQSGIRRKKNKKSACLLIGSVAVFAACWLPDHAINLWLVLSSDEEISETIYWIKVAALILTYTNFRRQPIHLRHGRRGLPCLSQQHLLQGESECQPGIAFEDDVNTARSLCRGRTSSGDHSSC
ncbi:GALR2 [Branchiostoma lanceolatum]|uniref:GALR2 protein n=1 Tax=Branchiostoma lanceolatum TaxID=7740 RepID=A0A8J9W3J5_BRALA|nr:GALR2 [Branchiostoma lanceolatum]